MSPSKIFIVVAGSVMLCVIATLLLWPGQDDDERPDPGATKSLTERLVTGDASQASGLIGRCQRCHTIEKGGRALAGPNLWNIVNRRAAAIPTPTYSGAMRKRGRDGHLWDFASLDAFLAAPRTYLPGTTMNYSGVKHTQDRANLILYLRTLSDQPAPLP